MARITSTLCSLVSLLFAVGASATDLNSGLIQTSGSPSETADRFYGYRTANLGPGNAAFREARDLAEREHVPLVVIWSHEACGDCNAFIGDLNANASAVRTWIAENKAVFTFFKATGYSTYYDPYQKKYITYEDAGPGITEPPACLDAYNFARYTCGSVPVWPLIGFYYKDALGNTIKWNHGDIENKTFAWMKDEYDKWVKDNKIGQYQGGAFTDVGSEYNRYEADETTSNALVRLVRDDRSRSVVWTNDLVAVWPQGEGLTVTQRVEWAVGESDKTVSIRLERIEGRDFPVGKSIALNLYDSASGLAKETASVLCRETEVSAGVPLWLGERTAETLGWGEWTMDIDVATQKVAQAVAKGEKAYTLVLMAGSLWCPDCYNVDTYLLGLTNAAGEVRFSKWAEERHLALAMIDIPRLNDGMMYPTLVSRETGLGFFPSVVTKSGLAYLTRKCVSDGDAERIYARNIALASRNTGHGGFHRPEDANPLRTGVPIFVLLRSDGTVTARLTRWANDSASVTDTARFDDFLRRFDEMIALAADGEHADATEIENNHPATTPLVADSNGGSAAGEISHADYQDVFRLAGANARTYQYVSVNGTDAAEVRVEFLTTNNAGEVETVASATNVLSHGIELGFRFEKEGDYFLRISGAADITDSKSTAFDYRTDFGTASAASTFHRYAFTADSVLDPSEKKAEASAPADGTNVIMVVEADTLYRVTGITGGVTGEFEKEGEDVYRAKIDGYVTLSTPEKGGRVTYQIWRPGEIAFETLGLRFLEYQGTGVIAVVRTGGSSGSNVVHVVCDNPPQDGRFTVPSDATLAWADGEDGAKEVRIPICPNGTYDPDVSFRMRLVKGDPCLAAVSSSTNVVTVYDTTDPCLERTAYDLQANLNFETVLALKAYNVSNAATVAVTVKRGSGAVPAGLGFTYDADSGNFLLSGVPTASGDYEFVVTVGEKRNGSRSVTSGFETTIRISVVDQSEVNPKLSAARPNYTMPVFCEILSGTNAIEGSLRFAVTSKGQISARYSGTEARPLAFAGNWAAIDVEGTVSNTLVAVDAEGEVAYLTMTMDADGFVRLKLDLPEGYSRFTPAGERTVLTAESAWPEDVDFTAWRGRYNVTFPYLGEVPTNVPSGTGYFLLRMESASAARKGRVVVAGLLPDGTSVSGSCNLLEDPRTDDGKVALLPLFRQTGGSCFSAAIEIGRDGWTNGWNRLYNEASGRLYCEIAAAVKDTIAFSLRHDAKWSYLALHDVYGSYFEPGTPLPVICDYFGYAEQAAFFRTEFASASARFGVMSVPQKKVDLTIDEGGMRFTSSVPGMTFSYNPNTGIFSGSVRVTYGDPADPVKQTAEKYRGVILPGWTSCGCGHIVPLRPFASGTLSFRDILNKKIVYMSIPVDIDFNLKN